MSTRGRTAEALGFWSGLILALALFAWRCSGQVSGLSADQTESLVLARSLVDGMGLRLTAASAFSAGPPISSGWRCRRWCCARARTRRSGSRGCPPGAWSWPCWWSRCGRLGMAAGPPNRGRAARARLEPGHRDGRGGRPGQRGLGWVLALAVVAALMAGGSRRGRAGGRPPHSAPCACSGPRRSGSFSRRRPRGGSRPGSRGGRPCARRCGSSPPRSSWRRWCSVSGCWCWARCRSKGCSPRMKAPRGRWSSSPGSRAGSGRPSPGRWWQGCGGGSTCAAAGRSWRGC